MKATKAAILRSAFLSYLAIACAASHFLYPNTSAHATEPKTSVWAGVRIPSHGCSGTIIDTQPGRTLILTCAHAFEGQDRYRPVKLDCPHCQPGQPRHARIRLLKVGVPDHDDLALLELNDGPLPYCAPVQAEMKQNKRALSVGYDEMRTPALYRPAVIVGADSERTFTRERPWHGRSGGALLDADTGELIGVVSGYSGPSNHRETYPGANGIYVSHITILRFLGRGPLGQAVPSPRLALPPAQAPFGAAPRFGFPGWRGFGAPGCPT